MLCERTHRFHIMTNIKTHIVKIILLSIFFISIISSLPVFNNYANRLTQIFLMLIVIGLPLIVRRKNNLPYVYKALILMFLLVLCHIVFDKPIPSQYNPYPTTYYLSHLMVGGVAYFIGWSSLSIDEKMVKGALISLILVSIFTLTYAKIDAELTYQVNTYTIMWLIPYCFIPKQNVIKKRKWIWGILLFAIFAILVTGKRTPLMTPVIGGIIAYLAWRKFSIKSVGKLIIGGSLLLTIVCLLAWDKINYMTARWNEDIMMSKSYGDYGNGRSLIWALLIENFKALPTFEQFLGSGFQNTKTMTSILWGMDIGAHNDFIDSLVNYGYVGFIIHVCFSLGMLVYGIKSIKTGSKESFLLLMLPIMWIITEMVSSNNVRFSSALYMFLYFYLVGKQQKHSLS